MSDEPNVSDVPSKQQIELDDELFLKSIARVVEQARYRSVSVRPDLAARIGVFTEDAVSEADAELALLYAGED